MAVPFFYAAIRLFVHERGIPCAKLPRLLKFVHERGILCANAVCQINLLSSENSLYGMYLNGRSIHVGVTSTAREWEKHSKLLLLW